MIISALKETYPGERRTPLLPATAGKYKALGAEVIVEKGIGSGIGLADSEYEKAGAKIEANRDVLLGGSDVLLRIRKPEKDDVAKTKEGTIHLSLLDPFNERDLIATMAAKGIRTVCLEMIPRSTIAQKMDVLSSQANLAGYFAVIQAAEHSPKIFPMMATPAGTISPCTVFIIGAGVAGLQAIATARRLGARVEAFDTRPVVEEQVKSLGAKFVKVDLGETGQTKDGYAKALTEEQLQKQREVMAKHCASADVVITTAQVFGRKAPIIVTKEMVAGMKRGSVIVDLAVETGGNVEGSVLGQATDSNGVNILGYENMPGRVPMHASQMFSSNLYNFIEHFWDKTAKSLKLDTADEIIQGCLIADGGKIINPMLVKHYEGGN